MMEALCPFHDENTPSFKVYPENNTWHTFCCNKGGGPVRLISEVRGTPVEQIIQKFSGNLSLLVSRDALAAKVDTREFVLDANKYVACAQIRTAYQRQGRSVEDAEAAYEEIKKSNSSEEIMVVLRKILYNK